MSHLSLASSNSPLELVQGLIQEAIAEKSKESNICIRLFNMTSTQEKCKKDSGLVITHGLLGKQTVNQQEVMDWISEQNFGTVTYKTEWAGNYDADVEFLNLCITR